MDNFREIKQIFITANTGLSPQQFYIPKQIEVYWDWNCPRPENIGLHTRKMAQSIFISENNIFTESIDKEFPLLKIGEKYSLVEWNNIFTILNNLLNRREGYKNLGVRYHGWFNTVHKISPLGN